LAPAQQLQSVLLRLATTHSNGRQLQPQPEALSVAAWSRCRTGRGQHVGWLCLVEPAQGVLVPLIPVAAAAGGGVAAGGGENTTGMQLLSRCFRCNLAGATDSKLYSLLSETEFLWQWIGTCGRQAGVLLSFVHQPFEIT